MSGDNRLPKSSASDYCVGGPAIILVKPQLGENIGMVSRAMLNCGLNDLRLVNPRDGWSYEKAEKAAAGSGVVLNNLKVFDTTEEAIADLNHVFATTARGRDMNKPVVTPRKAVDMMAEQAQGGGKAGILFGRESRGLHNDDIVLADTTVMVPLNPAYLSLNLAQAVLIMGYEWYQTQVDAPDIRMGVKGDTRQATKQELVGFFEHFDDCLTTTGFYFPPEKVPTMKQNLRNMFQRAQLTEQEVKTFRGILSSFMKFRRQAKDRPD